MRFLTENEALDYIVGKTIKDPSSPTDICVTKDRVESKVKYNKWVELKRLMFSPVEYEAMIGKSENQAMRDHYGNVFVDWAESKPRRRAIIIIESNQQTAANVIAKQIDIIGGENTFAGLGYSSTGKEPATHFGCSWNCSASEYDFLGENFTIFDGDKTSHGDVLHSLGLIPVDTGEMETHK